MGVSFFETMRGDLTDGWGQRHPIDFQIKAEARDAWRFVKDSRARITGIVHAPPWAEHAPLEGEIAISLIKHRTIRYRFSFEGPKGGRYEASGQKTIRWTRARTSLSTLALSLSNGDGREIARGTLLFDRHALPEFMGSWSHRTSLEPARLEEPGEGPPLSSLPEAMIALAEALIVPGEHVPEVGPATLEGLSEQLGANGILEQVARAGMRALDAACRLRHGGKHLAELDVEARRRWIDSLSEGGELARTAVMALGMPIKSAHFSRPDYLASIGFPTWEKTEPEAKPRYFQNVIEAEDLEAVTELEAEVVVVGTGAGGAAIAYELARRGVAVAMVEEGRFHRRSDFGGSIAGRMQQLWRYAGSNISLGTPIGMPLGRAVGGTTLINSGTCFGTPDAVLEGWRSELGLPDDFAPEHYHKAYTSRVAEMLEVEPGVHGALGTIAEVIGRGADALGYAHGPLPRNAPGCPGAGQCIFGCPEGAKRSTDVSFVPAALKAGASLFLGLPLTRILRRGRRVVAIEARGLDAHGTPKVLRLKAERFVLACGSLLSPLILKDNGIDLPWIGRNLSVHPAMGLLARCDRDLEPWSAIPQGYTVHALEDEGIRFEGYWLPPQLISATFPFHGELLTRWMDDFRRLGQFGFMVRDRGVGRVYRGPGGRPLITYSLTPESMRSLKRGAALCSEIFLAGGATEVAVPMMGATRVSTPAEARALETMKTGPRDFSLLGAHPLGTCRMGTHPDTAVVDSQHRVFGTENLHVVDGSTVPTSLGVNPQMTIMAMALRAGEILASHF